MTNSVFVRYDVCACEPKENISVTFCKCGE